MRRSGAIATHQLGPGGQRTRGWPVRNTDAGNVQPSAARYHQAMALRFTMYADDTGQPDIRPPADGERHTFAYGGVVVPDSGIENMERRWRDIKVDFFATRDEVKAADFVRDDSPIPYISDTIDRRTLAQGDAGRDDERAATAPCRLLRRQG
jgi:hypothetical protein